MQQELEPTPTPFEEEYNTVKIEERKLVNYSRANQLRGQPDYLTIYKAKDQSRALIAAEEVEFMDIKGKDVEVVKIIIPKGFQAVKASDLDASPPDVPVWNGNKYHKESNIIVEGVFNLSDSASVKNSIDLCLDIDKAYRGAGICAQSLATMRKEGNQLKPEMCVFFISYDDIEVTVADKFNDRAGKNSDFIKNGLFMIPVMKPDRGVMYFCIPKDDKKNYIAELVEWRNRIINSKPHLIIGIEDYMIFPIEEWHVLLCFSKKFYP